LGSAENKLFAMDKTIGIILHQKASALNNALFNNVLGVRPNTTGKEILERGKLQLQEMYPHIHIIETEKVYKILELKDSLMVTTNKKRYQANKIVIAVGTSNLTEIEGLTKYLIPHKNLPEDKKRLQLRNENHLVTKNMYVAGVLAGFRSQFAIAAGSGTQVATDILTKWNDDNTTMAHDVVN
jgi:hypothetical protein